MLEAEGIKALASEIWRRRNEGPSRRWRAPDDLREQVLEYARDCREQGEPVVDIAGRLGMVESTLYRWLRFESEQCTPDLKSVAIVPTLGGIEEEVEVRRQEPVRLITPQGYVVEGLDVELVVEVLRALG